MRARRLVVSLLLVPVGVVVVAAQANGIREVSASEPKPDPADHEDSLYHDDPLAGR